MGFWINLKENVLCSFSRKNSGKNFGKNSGKNSGNNSGKNSGKIPEKFWKNSGKISKKFQEFRRKSTNIYISSVVSVLSTLQHYTTLVLCSVVVLFQCCFGPSTIDTRAAYSKNAFVNSSSSLIMSKWNEMKYQPSFLTIET